MSVGGAIIDIVKVRADKWWVNTMDRGDLNHVAVYCNPLGEPIDVGDSLWWQGAHCYWTPADRSRQDVKLPKIGYSGVRHPDLAAAPQGGTPK